jgi:hypothetical protein
MFVGKALQAQQTSQHHYGSVVACVHFVRQQLIMHRDSISNCTCSQNLPSRMTAFFLLCKEKKGRITEIKPSGSFPSATAIDDDISTGAGDVN